MDDFIIDDNTPSSQLFYPEIDGERQRHGLVPRDYVANPVGCYASSADWSMEIPIIPKEEWSERIKELVAKKAQLSDIRNRADDGKPFRSLDQNGQGFCWAYSTTAAVMLLRAAANMPYRRLSAHAVACKIYNHRDRGAWGALSLDWVASHGVPTVGHWPEKSMSRSHDKPSTWANAMEQRVTEGWMDMDARAWDRDMTFAQVATCLLSGIPVVTDFNWWGHSVCAMDLVETSRNKFGLRILNSWTDRWGSNGTGVLSGSKAIPNGASCARAVVTQG